jgi:hypothetical protein
VFTIGGFANEVGTTAGRRIQVDLSGAYSGPGGPTGVLATLAAVAGAGLSWFCRSGPRSSPARF